ncbi:hypothetical protein [Algoriphagus sp. NG3]|uniref:hypothetical protein n=1 Tax=Algoriphagus sp. NG3 TaxID=3097546 RepID=UPI002A839A51|nr:hypothetical protein [Algoriphagus sp. NG3]WPR76301.1 hypothetical protein SLW71_02945 [Algoriphagus sp. NG3]
MSTAQQVNAPNAVKRNLGLGNPDEFAKSANGTFDKFCIDPTQLEIPIFPVKPGRAR